MHAGRVRPQVWLSAYVQLGIMADQARRRIVSPRRPSDTADAKPFDWYSRGYLPHFDGGQLAQTITFRLFDSMPQSILDQWRVELAHLTQKDAEAARRKRIEAYIDRGCGHAWLKIPEIADLIQQAILFFVGQRYRLGAWVVMPNHVHVLVTPNEGWELGRILHSWKSFTSKECNKVLGRHGEFWQTESFDRYVRDEQHYHNAITYIENNPVNAGRCERPEDWPSSSARPGGARVSRA